MGSELASQDSREGRVVLRVALSRHRCSPPGWWQRRKLDLDFGSVWACECGQHWEWQFTYADESWMRV